MDFKALLIEIIIMIAGKAARDALKRAIEIARELQETSMSGAEKQTKLRDMIKADLKDAPGYLVGLLGEAAVTLMNEELAAIKKPA